MLVLALTKLVEIVGEAAKQVTATTRALHPDVPWSAAARMRDRLVHHYFDIDLDVLTSSGRRWRRICPACSTCCLARPRVDRSPGPGDSDEGSSARGGALEALRPRSAPGGRFDAAAVWARISDSDRDFLTGGRRDSPAHTTSR
ncbi:DUF86 domain-containing protein [Iamia sp.]|uniref:HepT-like ribonuclease domain-containing protein n=1 Tax=Iamia sp. TaxID=2722710 RepID=UPI0032C21DD4